MTRIESIFSVLLILSVATGLFAASLPSGIKQCKFSDPSLTTCLTNSAQKFVLLLKNGIPELGLSSINPLIIPDVFNNDTILTFKFTNNKIFELKPTLIEEVKINQSKKKITLTVLASGRTDSNYTVNGRLMILPVTGEGQSHITITDIRFVYKISYDVVKGKDGKDYWKILKYRVTYTPKLIQYHFLNLFSGNKELADALHLFINENWKDIFNQFSKDPMKAMTDTVINYIEKIFSSIPVNDLILP